MSKSVTGNIWRLDKGIKRLEKSIAEVDSGIAQLKRDSISESQYNRMREEVKIIANRNQEIITILVILQVAWVLDASVRTSHIVGYAPGDSRS